MYLKYTVIIFLFATLSCSGNLENQKQKLDQIYGYCDNPQREFNDLEYKICKANERAAGPSGKGIEKEPLSLSKLTDLLNGKGSSESPLISNINPSLWQAALDVTSNYNLKIADSSGGFIQTEWINDPNLSNQRCLIKIQILSSELISTGVKTSILCETYANENWASSDEKFLAEEKKLTLKILELAQEYSKINS